jgi:hypothetical protein
MESSHDPIMAAPRSICPASILHESPVLGGGNEKCRPAATPTTVSSGTTTTPCFVMASVPKRQQRSTDQTRKHEQAVVALEPDGDLGVDT